MYQIFSRMAFEKVDNLCVLGGDAARVLPSHLRRASVSHVFINFPEPPHHSGDEAASNSRALLTKDFFRSLLRDRRGPRGLLPVCAGRLISLIAGVQLVTLPAVRQHRVIYPLAGVQLVTLPTVRQLGVIYPLPA